MVCSFGAFPVKVSARHLHLRQETVELLFGRGYILEPDGYTDGLFRASVRVSVVGPKGSLARVAVMGPCRRYDQLEISATDARTLGNPAVLRASGSIEGTPGILLVGPVGEVALEQGVIVAERHIHMSREDAAANGFRNGEKVLMCVESEGRTTVFADTAIRVNLPDRCGPLAHIDTDEGNACGCGKEGVARIVGRREALQRFFRERE